MTIQDSLPLWQADVERLDREIDELTRELARKTLRVRQLSHERQKTKDLIETAQQIGENKWTKF